MRRTTLRLLLGAETTIGQAARLAQMAISEGVWAFTHPAERDRLTAAIYDARPGYLPGGALFERGLDPWERSLFARLPAGGHLLVGAAGGGREAVALAEAGHRITAFDPVASYADALAAALAQFPACVGLRASYADLMAAADRLAGGDTAAPLAAAPLAAALAAAPLDGIVLGMGSYSHLIEADQRVALLRALRRLAPRARVALSFLVRVDRPGGVERLRPALRGLFAALGAPGHARDGEYFLSWAGFVATFNLSGVVTEAAAAGYRLADGADDPAWALLEPA